MSKMQISACKFKIRALAVQLFFVPAIVVSVKMPPGNGARNFRCEPITCDESRGFVLKPAYPAEPEKCQSDCLSSPSRNGYACLGYRWLKNVKDNATSCALYALRTNDYLHRQASCETDSDVKRIPAGTGATCISVCPDLRIENGVAEYIPKYEITPVDSVVPTFKCNAGYRLIGFNESGPWRCFVWSWNAGQSRDVECIEDSQSTTTTVAEPIPTFFATNSDAALTWSEYKRRTAASLNICHDRCKQRIPSMWVQIALIHCEGMLRAQFHAEFEYCLNFNGVFLITDYVPCWIGLGYDSGGIASSSAEQLVETGLDAYHACLNECKRYFTLQDMEGCSSATRGVELEFVYESCDLTTRNRMPEIARTFYVPCALAAQINVGTT